MKKEVVIAIIIGFSVGLIITYGIHTAQTSLLAQKDATESALSPSSNTTLTDPTGEGTHSIIIYSPQSPEILDEEPARISGITTPYSMVSAIGVKIHTSSVADSQGSFVIELPLEEGANVVALDSFAPGGERASQSLELVYTTTTLDVRDTASSSAARR